MIWLSCLIIAVISMEQGNLKVLEYRAWASLFVVVWKMTTLLRMPFSARCYFGEGIAIDNPNYLQ